MKIDVRHIIQSHAQTLVNAATGRTSIADYALFYLVPAVPVIFIVFDQEKFPASFYGVAISVFSVFAALLFSVQIALFSILQRDIAKKDASPGDTKSTNIVRGQIEERRGLIREVNANISYLILVASLGVAVLLTFTLTEHFASVRSSISTYILGHFLLNVLLVISRMHTLFDVEYQRP